MLTLHRYIHAFFYGKIIFLLWGLKVCYYLFPDFVRATCSLCFSILGFDNTFYIILLKFPLFWIRQSILIHTSGEWN